MQSNGGEERHTSAQSCEGEERESRAAKAHGGADQQEGEPKHGAAIAGEKKETLVRGSDFKKIDRDQNQTKSRPTRGEKVGRVVLDEHR